jgi:outer membrane protein TolC
MKRLKIFSIALFSLLNVATDRLVAAEELPLPGAWTLAECQSEALRQSRDLKAADARLRAARATARQAARWINPEFALTTLSSEREFHLTQEFDLWGKGSAAARWAQAEADTVLTRRGALERELLEEVARQFWRMAVAQKLVSLGREELRAWGRFLDIRQQEVEVGAFPHTEMLLLRETAAEREQAVRQARFEGESAQAVLNTLLARRPDEPLIIDGTFPAERQLSAEQLFAAALETDPMANEARARVIAAGYRIDQEQKRWRPNPRFGPAAKEEDRRWDAGVQLRFSMPILDRNRDSIRAAAAGRDQAAFELEAAELLAVQKAHSALLNRLMLSEAVAEYESRILPLAEERLRQATRGFEAGDLSEREVVAIRLEWLRRKQETEILRHRSAEAASLLGLIARPFEPESEPARNSQKN